MKLGLFQAGTAATPEETLALLSDYTGQAAEAGCQVLCSPECFLTGYAPEQAARLAICADDPILCRVNTLARDHGLDLLLGFMERDGNSFYITQGLFRPDGTRQFYRKTHLGRREQRFFAPGDALKVFTLTCGLPIGIALCVETHYPQIAQTLALRGAQVIFAPHAVPRVSGDRQSIWGKYICARSYDNRVYMACCNLWDPERFGGGCLVTGPRGQVSAACYEDRPALLTCTVDPVLLASFRDADSARSRHFYPALRRTELYD